MSEPWLSLLVVLALSLTAGVAAFLVATVTDRRMRGVRQPEEPEEPFDPASLGEVPRLARRVNSEGAIVGG